MNQLFKAVLFVFLFASWSGLAFSQAPQLINFQAQIEGVSDGTASITFSIHDAPTGGNQLWSETHPTLIVTNGRIQTILGSISGLDSSILESDGERYIQLAVNGEELAPRSQLTSVAFALRAATADRLTNGGEVGGVTTLNTLTGDVTIEAGTNVSITPQGQSLRIDAAGGGGTGGITTINAGTGITVSDTDGPVTEIGLAPDQINDLQIEDNSLTANSLATNSVGSAQLQETIVLGPGGNLEVTNSSSETVSLVGTNAEEGYIGIRDRSGAYDAITLTAREDGLGGRFALRGNDIFSAIEMFSDSDTDGGRMVFREPQGDGSSSSLIFTANNGAGRIVMLDDNDVVISLQGDTQDIISKGSLGLGYSGSINDSQVDPLYTLDVIGDARITGNLSKGSGSFTIDHPLDPLNKNLSHSFVESPDMMNVYNGNVVLDENGEAWVELPEWFDVLNVDFRYQLTCIGGYAPVYIAEKIQDNKFKIAGGVKDLEVSWLVTGIRNDPYAQVNRIQVEEDKNERERGTYLHPEAYRQNN